MHIQLSSLCVVSYIKILSNFFFKEQFDVLKKLAPNVDAGKLSQLLSCAHALVSQEAVTIGLPDFPLDSLSSAALILVNIVVSGNRSRTSPSWVLALIWRMLYAGQKPRLVGVRRIL